MTDDAQASSLVDPDPWVIINTAISAVAAFAQVWGLRKQPTQRPGNYHLQVHLDDLLEKIADCINDAERDISRAAQILGSAKADVGDVLEQKFQFGQTAMYIPSQSAPKFVEIISKLSMATSHISSWTLNLVSIHPHAAAQLGVEIALKVDNINEKINGLYRGVSNDEAISTCVQMMRLFQDILTTYKRSNIMY